MLSPATQNSEFWFGRTVTNTSGLAHGELLQPAGCPYATGGQQDPVLWISPGGSTLLAGFFWPRLVDVNGNQKSLDTEYVIQSLLASAHFTAIRR